MSEFIEVLSKEAKAELDAFIKQLNEGVKSVNQINASFKKTKVPSSTNKEIKKTVESTKKLSQAQKKAVALTEKALKSKEKERLAEIQLQKARETAFKKYDATLTKSQKAREKQVNAESRVRERLSSQLKKETREREKQVNKESRLRDRLEAQRQKEIVQRQKAAEVSKKLGREYNILTGKMDKVGKVVQDLNAKKLQGKKLSDAEQIELKQSTAEFKKYQKAVLGADASIGRHNRNVGNYPKVARGAIGAARNLASAMGLLGGAFLIVQVARDAFNSIRQFDKQLIAVRKTTNLSKKEIDLFGKQVVILGLQLKGISIQGLLNSAEIAGQLGIRGSKNILNFSKTIEQLKLTSNIAGQEGAMAFAKFIEISKDTVENADRLGSVITELGNNFNTTESEILANSLEIQRAASIYKVTAEASLALGATTSALGIRAESARSAFLSTFMVLNDGVATGKNLDLILRLTGQSAAAFKKEFNTDATATFQKFIKGLSDAKDNGENLTLILKELSLDSKIVLPVVGTLADKYDILKETLASANKEYVDNNALSKEAATSADSLDSIIGDLGDSWDGLILSIDSGNGVISKFIKNSLKGLTIWVDKLGELALTQDELAKKDYNRILQEQANEYDRLGDGAEKAAKQNKALFESLVPSILDDIAERTEIINDKWGSSGREIIRAKEELVDLNKRYREYKAGIEAATIFLDKNTEAVNNNTEGTKEYYEFIIANAIKEQKSLQKSSQAWRDYEEDIKNAQAAIDSLSGGGLDELTVISQKYFEDIIAGLKKQQREGDSSVWMKHQKQIEDAEAAYLKWMRSVKGFEDQTTVNALTTSSETVTSNPEIIGAEIETTSKNIKTASEKMVADMQGAFNEIGRMYQLDMSRWTALFDDKENTVKDYAIAFADLLGAISFQITASEIANIDNKIAANRNYYEDQIALAEGNEQQQQLLREQQERREKELLTRRAKAEQKQALFEAVVGTASAVIKALPNIPLSILVGALGAAKIAMIANQPLPEYKKGRKGGKEEYAILGDGYKNEPIIGKDGSLKGVSPNKPALMHLDKGDSVLPNLDMLTNDSVNRAAIMASLQTQNYKAEDTAKVFEQILKDQQKETMRALKKAKFVNNNFNKVDISSQLRKMRYR